MPDFIQINREDVYEGRVFSVARLQYRLPDGRLNTYDMVDHAAAVVIIPVDSEGNLIFIHQFRIGADRNLIELPAGVIDPGENPEDGARRELREETGMSAQSLIAMGGWYMTPGYCNEYIHLFLARELFPAPLEADSDEFLHIQKISPLEAYQMARNGAIQDGKTLAALFIAEPHLG